jgi:hypothetical protein
VVCSWSTWPTFAAGSSKRASTHPANGVNPQAYLTDVLKPIQHHPQHRIGDLLPVAWAAEQVRRTGQPRHGPDGYYEPTPPPAALERAAERYTTKARADGTVEPLPGALGASSAWCELRMYPRYPADNRSVERMLAPGIVR